MSVRLTLRGKLVSARQLFPSHSSGQRLDQLEPEGSLVVDNLFPSDRRVRLLRDFHAEFPTVPVRLLVHDHVK